MYLYMLFGLSKAVVFIEISFYLAEKNNIKNVVALQAYTLTRGLLQQNRHETLLANNV